MPRLLPPAQVLLPVILLGPNNPTLAADRTFQIEVEHIIEIVDQWYGPGYRYVKVRTHDNSVYILLFDEIRDQWELIMFCAAPAQEWQRKYHDLARSAQSRQ